MLATYWLLGCVMVSAQPERPVPSQPLPSKFSAPRGGDWVLTPRLAKGQELVYRGTFHEQAATPGLRYQRDYRLELRFFVLDESARGLDLAALTSLRHKHEPPVQGVVRHPQSAAVRLERLLLEPRGRLGCDPTVSLQVPLEGVPSLEVGAFHETPRGHLSVKQSWESHEQGRSPQSWTIVGLEQVSSQSCVKLVGTQQSEDWDRPRADRGAWQRLDTVWIASRTGVTIKVERVIERRQPASREVSQRSTLRYDLESSMQYTARLAADRRQEALLALTYRDEARPLFVAPGKTAASIKALQRKIDLHLDNTPPTAFRECLLQVKRQLEAASKGELVQVAYQEPVAAPKGPTVATIGDLAPDFVCSEITSSGSARLTKWKGKGLPVILVFYHPGSFTAPELLRFVGAVQRSYPKSVFVVGLSVSDDTSAVLKQRAALKVDFPVLHGGGLRISYAVTGTPKIVVLDGTGIVRGMYDGWGPDTSNEVLTEPPSLAEVAVSSKAFSGKSLHLPPNRMASGLRRLLGEGGVS